jgi:hypothetical protein
MTDRRSTDPDGIDFSGIRVPRRWKAWILSAGTVIGTAVGTYVAMKEKVDKRPNELNAVSTALQTLADLKIAVDNLNSTLALINSDRGATLEIVRDMRGEIGRLARRVSIEENAVDRHNEVMGKLDDFEKKGIKRK